MCLYAFVGLAAFEVAACTDTSPLSPLLICESEALATLAHHEGSIDVRCDLGRDVYLLALPEGEVSDESLIKLGLPENARFVVRGSSHPTWCTVEEREPFQAPGFEAERNFTSTCTASVVHVDSPIGAHSSTFLLSFATTGEQKFSVVSITAQ